MLRFIHHIFLLIFLQISVAGFAQYSDQDSVVTSVEVGESTYEETNGFTQIYRPSTVQVKKIPQEKIEELKREDAYWYANIEPEQKKAQKIAQQPSKRSNSFADQKWFQNLLWIIILCSFIVIVIWYLASSNIRLFSKASKKIVEEEQVDEEIDDDIFAIAYEKEIQKAEKEENYRLAVRLWYLKTLRELTERNIIDYRHERTNNDYVNSLYGGRYYRDFFRLTRNFEYTWYGQFQLSSEGYEMMRRDFSAFKNILT